MKNGVVRLRKDYNFISFTVVLAAGEHGLTTEKEMCGKPLHEPRCRQWALTSAVAGECLVRKAARHIGDNGFGLGVSAALHELSI